MRSAVWRSIELANCVVVVGGCECFGFVRSVLVVLEQWEFLLMDPIGVDSCWRVVMGDNLVRLNGGPAVIFWYGMPGNY